MQLYELPNRTPIRVWASTNGSPMTKRDALFHHIDGMYSYCTFDEEPRGPFHIKAWTEMVEVDGRWEIVDQVEAAESGALVTGDA